MKLSRKAIQDAMDLAMEIETPLEDEDPDYSFDADDWDVETDDYWGSYEDGLQDRYGAMMDYVDFASPLGWEY